MHLIQQRDMHFSLAEKIFCEFVRWDLKHGWILIRTRGWRLTRIFEEFISYCDDAHTAEISHGERKQSCMRESRIVYDTKRNAFTIFLCAPVIVITKRGFANFLAVRDIFFYICDATETRADPGRYQSHLYAVAFSSEREQWTISSTERPSVDVMFTVDVTTPRHEFCVPFMKSPTSEWRNTKHLPPCKAHVEYFIRPFSIFTIIRNPLLLLCTLVIHFYILIRIIMITKK